MVTVSGRIRDILRTSTNPSLKTPGPRICINSPTTPSTTLQGHLSPCRSSLFLPPELQGVRPVPGSLGPIPVMTSLFRSIPFCDSNQDLSDTNFLDTCTGLPSVSNSKTSSPFIQSSVRDVSHSGHISSCEDPTHYTTTPEGRTRS